MAATSWNNSKRPLRIEQFLLVGVFQKCAVSSLQYFICTYPRDRIMIRVGRNLLDIRRAAAKKLDISLWTDVKKKKPFKAQRTRDQKPQRYGVVDR